MTDIDTINKAIYKAIKTNSNFIIEQGDQWKKELSGAKNYIATPNLKHWTFGKSVGADGEYHDNGGTAKLRLYNLGFINVLDIKDKNSRETILNAFLTWAKKVDKYPILEKFERDQKANKRFELLVHQSLLNDRGKYVPKVKSNQELLDEGFKYQIIKEVTYRNRKIVALAKQHHGTTCAVCDFDFAKTYGSHGEGFIEMHHLYPIAGGTRKTSVEDLRPVCANCHRMLHRGKELLSIGELKVIIKEN
jgi:predicted HNH restriction endonuclease